MRMWLCLFWLLLVQTGSGQNIQSYFESIRGNAAALTAFFSQMPKGGDLHNHYSGAVYAEPMLERAIREDFYLNTQTMQVARTPSATGTWERLSVLKSKGQLEDYKYRILSQWSVKDYNGVDIPSYRLFFESFNKFGEAEEDDFAQGLLQLKNRAIKENLSYIETQFSQVHTSLNTDDLTPYNETLRRYAQERNEQAVMIVLDSLFRVLESRGATQLVQDYNEHFIRKWHDSLRLDDSQFTMRFQNFVLRFKKPVALFADLALSFLSANTSPYVVGVNIVAPEHGEVALKDYWLHMMFFKFCHAKFPNVKYSMHAGELSLGLVQPEELSWHINAAVRLAGANRIGHGVDLPNETDCYDLLRYMKQHQVAVEINLVSNEFILHVKEDRHPILLYKKFGVPIVICSDDPGVLRTNMTEQYVLLAKRYPELSYADIKEMVYNSIRFSFIKEDAVKKALLSDLDIRFRQFENKVMVANGLKK